MNKASRRHCVNAVKIIDSKPYFFELTTITGKVSLKRADDWDHFNFLLKKFNRSITFGNPGGPQVVEKIVSYRRVIL